MMKVQSEFFSDYEPLVRPVMPELDTVRGLAILSVLFYHGFAWSYRPEALTGLPRIFVWLTTSGWLGVNLFFVLSGFLITGILLESKYKPHYYKRFYCRRALRILPAYYAVLLVLAIARQASWPFLSLSVCYLSNITTIFGIPRDYGVLWSLAVEEHFYLLWPTVVRRLQQGYLAICALAIILVVPLLRGYSFFYGFRGGLNHYTWFVVDGLACGALLATYVRRPSITRAAVARTAGWAIAVSAVMLALGAPFGLWTQRQILGAALQVVPWNLLFTAFVAVMLLLGTNRWKALVRRPLLMFFGDISYGLYLIHTLIFKAYDTIVWHFWPTMASVQMRFAPMMLRFVCVASTAVALAFLSRRYFEEPFLRLKNRLPLTENVEPLPVNMKELAVKSHELTQSPHLSGMR